MNREELSKILDGRQYRDEITKEEIEKANEAGLVVVYGASDDIMEVVGAMDDELYPSNGESIRINKQAEIVKKGGKGI